MNHDEIARLMKEADPATSLIGNAFSSADQALLEQIVSTPPEEYPDAGSSARGGA